jgi:leader peptidase (prepilin peptidase)/N-methyltransferase
MVGTPWWLVVAFGAVFGACTGSFVAVVVERVPRRESLNGRSRCVCGRPLRWFENVPLLAWPALGGTSRCCGASIPRWYWLVELACAGWGALVGWVYCTGAPWWVCMALAVGGWSMAAAVGMRRGLGQ